MKREKWKDIKNYKSYYQVSNFGNIKSLERIVTCRNGVKRKVNERILKPVKDKYGYLRVTLAINSNKPIKQIHRVVMETFRGFSDLQVNHIDGNKENNNLNNLEFSTHLENTNHKVLQLNKKKRYGVYFIKRNSKYRAIISLKDKRVHLGVFNNEEEAYSAFHSRYLLEHGSEPWRD